MICNDDGNATAIPSHPSRIGRHILPCTVTKFSRSSRLLGRSLCLILLEQCQCSSMTHNDYEAVIMASKNWTAIPLGIRSHKVQSQPSWLLDWHFVSPSKSNVDAPQQYAMMMALQLPYHHIHQGLDGTSSHVLSQSSAAAVDCSADPFASSSLSNVNAP